MTEVHIQKFDERDPERLVVYDTTLREGHQSPHVAFDTEGKVRIAEHLRDAGVDVIEAGFPASMPGDFEAVQAVAQSIQGPQISALSRARHHDIDRAWAAIEDAESTRIHTFIATSESHIAAMNMTPESVLKATVEAVQHARELADHVEFSPEDASRSDFGYMIEVIQAAIDAGADTINIPDTVGFAVPEYWRERIAKVGANIVGSVVISTHNHDDLGLSAANTLAAIQGGARQVEVAVNGVGERAGNASMESVIAAVKLHPGVYGEGLVDHINTHEIGPLSRTVSQEMGIPVSPYTPVVGSGAFAHEAGIHQQKWLEDPATYEIMRASEWGWEGEQIVYGSHSGVAAFRALARDNNIVVNNLPEIVGEIKEICHARQRAMSADEVLGFMHAKAA